MKIDLRPRSLVLIALFVLLVFYALYEARALISGPYIKINQPQDGSMVASPLVIVEGESSNISWISLNGRQIFTDNDGRWSEKLLVSPGLSIISLYARDRFGRETEEEIQVVLK